MIHCDIPFMRRHSAIEMAIEPTDTTDPSQSQMANADTANTRQTLLK